jgi:magnesium-transporting ATPase (P-type)
MRTIINIETNCTKTRNFFSTQINQNFDSWKFPANETELIEDLKKLLYEAVKKDIDNKDNIALEHNTLKECYLLITFKEDDNSIQVRLFYDHIQTLRKQTSLLLKIFQKSIMDKKFTFDPTEITISEVQKDNVLDKGYYYKTTKSLLNKLIFKDKKIETIFVIIIFFITLYLIYYVINHFKEQTLTYEIVSKCMAPFIASTILTLINITTYLIGAYKNTNIIWEE